MWRRSVTSSTFSRAFSSTTSPTTPSSSSWEITSRRSSRPMTTTAGRSPCTYSASAKTWCAPSMRSASRKVSCLSRRARSAWRTSSIASSRSTTGSRRIERRTSPRVGASHGSGARGALGGGFLPAVVYRRLASGLGLVLVASLSGAFRQPQDGGYGASAGTRRSHSYDDAPGLPRRDCVGIFLGPERHSTGLHGGRDPRRRRWAHRASSKARDAPGVEARYGSGRRRHPHREPRGDSSRKAAARVRRHRTRPLRLRPRDRREETRGKARPRSRCLRPPQASRWLADGVSRRRSLATGSPGALGSRGLSARRRDPLHVSSRLALRVSPPSRSRVKLEEEALDSLHRILPSGMLFERFVGREAHLRQE